MVKNSVTYFMNGPLRTFMTEISWPRISRQLLNNRENETYRCATVNTYSGTYVVATDEN